MPFFFNYGKIAQKLISFVIIYVDNFVTDIFLKSQI